MAVVVTAPFGYEILRRDAIGATFVSGSITSGELLAALFRTALRESKMQSCRHWRLQHRANVAAVTENGKRDIATFLLLEASRR